jgi:hypothetical protein
MDHCWPLAHFLHRGASPHDPSSATLPSPHSPCESLPVKHCLTYSPCPPGALAAAAAAHRPPAPRWQPHRRAHWCAVTNARVLMSRRTTGLARPLSLTRLGHRSGCGPLRAIGHRSVSARRGLVRSPLLFTVLSFLEFI